MMNDTFRAFHRVLACAGVSIFADKNWDSKSWLLLQILNFFVGGLCFIFTTGFVLTNYSDFLLCIQGACIWTTGVIMAISLLICLIFRNDFRCFLEEMAFRDGIMDIPLIEQILLVQQGGKTVAELRNLVFDTHAKLLKYSKVFLKTYVTIVFTCATLYLCNPIYMMLVRKDETLRLLAYDMWFPWSLKNLKVYILSFIFHGYAGFLCCIAYPGFQSTIILLHGQLIRQMKIVAFILLHVNELALEITGDQDDTWQAYCTMVLAQCVDHYVKLKRFSNRVNIICRPFYLSIILVCIMAVCMCSVKIATSSKFSLDTTKYYVHAFCFVFVVFIFSLLGQQVENECEVLERAVTEKWYIFNKSHKMNVRIFHMALSQHMPIYIFGTITLSSPTFTWFIKTGMSFFTLVMSVLEEENP